MRTVYPEKSASYLKLMRQLCEHLKKFLPQIRNALRYSYSNGPLECLNNHIKVLKRNAYGFRNFYNFKRRIMICHGKTILTK
ncbi:transposase [Enterococcus hirae]|uniref:transposase n=2 Tax=Enterococcus hirae TaxID=1354 RepID=UPI001F5F1A37|nr:transposase [Enterococcus hirae]